MKSGIIEEAAMTCRLRKDPALRMLLCNVRAFGVFRGVLGRRGGFVQLEEERIWELGGQSVYFRDPDRHLIEIATPGVWSIY